MTIFAPTSEQEVLNGMATVLDALRRDDFPAAAACLSRLVPLLDGTAQWSPSSLAALEAVQAECLKQAVALRHLLVDRADRMGGVQRAMRAYAHVNGQG